MSKTLPISGSPGGPGMGVVIVRSELVENVQDEDGK